MIKNLIFTKTNLDPVNLINNSIGALGIAGKMGIEKISSLFGKKDLFTDSGMD